MTFDPKTPSPSPSFFEDTISCDNIWSFFEDTPGVRPPLPHSARLGGCPFPTWRRTTWQCWLGRPCSPFHLLPKVRRGPCLGRGRPSTSYVWQHFKGSKVCKAERERSWVAVLSKVSIERFDYRLISLVLSQVSWNKYLAIIEQPFLFSCHYWTAIAIFTCVHLLCQRQQLPDK